MAYAAVRSLAQILHQTLNRDYQYLILDEKQQIESLVEKITSLQKDFSSQTITQDEERDIRDAAYIAEDIIESRLIERFRKESAGNEDGSTEKKLIRFDVIENWIVSSSSSASSRSGLEIVGVGGIEKPRTFQTIYGIRQLARTLRFKTWFLDIDVLVNEEKPYLVAGEEAYMDDIEEQHMNARVKPYLDAAIWALERLATHGTKIIVIISYSSMREESETMRKLRRLGFDTSLFVGAITTEDLRANYAWSEEPEPSNIDITSGAELGVTKKFFFTGLKHRKFFPQISQVKKIFTLKFKWACWKKPSPAPSPRPCATWYDPDATEEYKSPMAMAGVDATDHFLVMRNLREYGSPKAMVSKDAADRCIVVTRDLRDIEAANAAGISSIFMTDHFGGTIYGSHEFADAIAHVSDLAARHDAHPTYVLPSFTW